MKEIMMIRSVDNEPRLKLFQVDDADLAKLTRIRGNLYKDDPRLKLARDLPTPKPKIELTPEMQARADAAYAKCLAEQATPAAIQPKPMSFEEQLAHDWRFNPSIRKEFTSQASYAAYMRAAESGRCRAYGV